MGKKTSKYEQRPELQTQKYDQTSYGQSHEDGKTPKKNVVFVGFDFPDSIIIYDYGKEPFGALAVIIIHFTHTYYICNSLSKVCEYMHIFYSEL